MNTTNQKFDQLLVEAIDEVLGSLGEPVKNHLYIHLENDFLITKKELPNQIEEFSHFLFRIFGSSANNLEIRFMRTLYSKIKVYQQFEQKPINFNDGDLTFSTYVIKLRENFENSSY
jgi:hypothetical protein